MNFPLVPADAGSGHVPNPCQTEERLTKLSFLTNLPLLLCCLQGGETPARNSSSQLRWEPGGDGAGAWAGPWGKQSLQGWARRRHPASFRAAAPQRGH